MRNTSYMLVIIVCALNAFHAMAFEESYDDSSNPILCGSQLQSDGSYLNKIGTRTNDDLFPMGQIPVIFKESSISNSIYCERFSAFFVRHSKEIETGSCHIGTKGGWFNDSNKYRIVYAMVNDGVSVKTNSYSAQVLSRNDEVRDTAALAICNETLEFVKGYFKRHPEEIGTYPR